MSENQDPEAAETGQTESIKAVDPAAPCLVNWSSDAWFEKYHGASLTYEFRAWWLGYYGIPEAYGDGYDEQHEYWTRCAFALMGWMAARNDQSDSR